MSEVKKLRPARTTFHNAHDVPTYCANNAWALDTAENAIVLKFYVDVPVAPKETFQELTPEGTLSNSMTLIPDSTKTPNYEVVREFQCGVVLSKKGLRAVHDLLKRIIDAQDKLTK